MLNPHFLVLGADGTSIETQGGSENYVQTTY